MQWAAEGAARLSEGKRLRKNSERSTADFPR